MAFVVVRAVPPRSAGRVIGPPVRAAPLLNASALRLLRGRKVLPDPERPAPIGVTVPGYHKSLRVSDDDHDIPLPADWRRLTSPPPKLLMCILLPEFTLTIKAWVAGVKLNNKF
jgi:hypothetical protein